ncbi:MAG: sulfurtransferase TusA family protein [Gammaproteobacteria bacterium]|nr:sulfurtransferase TusA family protein [Gammaproteobacteria bacterium]
MTAFDVELDTSGQNCPMPIMHCKKALHKMESGQVLHLIATDPGSRDDIPQLVLQINCKVIDSDIADGNYHFYIQKN